MGDLRGPRIRVGEVENGSIHLETGQLFTLTPQKIVGSSEKVSISYPDLAQDIQIGSRILLDDGNIALEVEEIKSDGDVISRVTHGADLSSNRGVNLPHARVSLPSLTDKDFIDIEFAISHGLDFLALSFVQSAEDVQRLKDHLAEKGAKIPVIAKIERKSALEDIENIAKTAYGVMVARGDLALEMSFQDVPIAQKRIIATCRRHAIPVITATQMLESMIHMNKPTRAEATDVANAILDGTDAVMLSAETAIGEYPVEAIATMSTIATSTENAWFQKELPGPPALDAPEDIESTVAYACHVVATSLHAKAIVTYTAHGFTARRIACHRPSIPILALSAYKETGRRLALSWGVETSLTEHINTTDHMVTVAVQQAQFCGVAGPGETIVMTAGTPPYGASGRTNTLKVERLPNGEDPKASHG
jgi:pyruvate kinase